VSIRLRSIPDLFVFTKEAKAIRGLPDLIGCYRGWFFGLELKRSAEGCNERSGRVVLQKYRGTQIHGALGYFAFVHPDNLEKVLQDIAGFPFLYDNTNQSFITKSRQLKLGHVLPCLSSNS